jgi:K+-transporting ATPase A subunit
MSKKHARDAIKELLEWEQHMYTPGYYINRFSPFFPPKPSIWTWILTLIDFVLLVPAAIAMTWLAIVERSVILAVLAAITVLFVVITSIMLWRMWPSHRKLEQRLRAANDTAVRVKKEKKKYPRRRKDYK